MGNVNTLRMGYSLKTKQQNEYADTLLTQWDLNQKLN